MTATLGKNYKNRQELHEFEFLQFLQIDKSEYDGHAWEELQE